MEGLEQRMAAVKAEKEALFKALFENNRELEDLNVRLWNLERRR